MTPRIAHVIHHIPAPPPAMTEEEVKAVIAKLPAEVIAKILEPRLALYYTDHKYSYELPHAAIMLAYDLQGRP